MVIKLCVMQVNGRTALHLAANAGHADVVEKLCSTVYMKRSNGKTLSEGDDGMVAVARCHILADDVSVCYACCANT